MKQTRKSLGPGLVSLLLSGFLGGWPLAARGEDPSEPAAVAPSDTEVARAVFARSIALREPQDVLSSLDPDAQEIFFFSELLGMEGQTVRHRWELDGEVMAEVAFEVGGSRWRVYSSKRLLPGQSGSWTVSVVDGSGKLLRSETLSRALASSEPSSSTPPAAPGP
jgi:hypothetical protein